MRVKLKNKCEWMGAGLLLLRVGGGRAAAECEMG